MYIPDVEAIIYLLLHNLRDRTFNYLNCFFNCLNDVQVTFLKLMHQENL